jgi:hypothetical protein
MIKLNNGPLQLIYEIPQVATYVRSVRVQSVDKPQVDGQYGVLRSRTNFICPGPWFIWKQVTRETSPKAEGAGKAYERHKMTEQGRIRNAVLYNDGTMVENLSPLSFVYQPRKQDFSGGIRFKNDSIYFGVSNDSALSIVIEANEDTGPIINPGWSMYDCNNQIYGVERFNMTLNPGFRLTVNTDIAERKITLTRLETGEEYNATSFMDPTADGFVRAPLGECMLGFNNNVINAMRISDTNISTVKFKTEWVVV